MSGQHVNAAWQARLRAVPIAPALTLTTEGLVLGAGTVLLSAPAPRHLSSLQGQEARVLALLAAAYGKPITLSVRGIIERAAKAWREGDDFLAQIHLAHTQLYSLHDVRVAAYRLFLADGALRAGASTSDVLRALHLDAGFIDAVEKYNPDQPRVPAGSGRTSGEWTDSEETRSEVAPKGAKAGEGSQGSSLLGRMPLPAASFLGELGAAQLAELGAYVARLLGPGGAAAAVLGLLFIPSPNNVRVEGEVSGVPGLRYEGNRDEGLFHFTYDAGDGEQRTFAAYVDGDQFRDEQGRVIGRVLPDGGILIELAVASPDLVKNDEPRLCPIPGPDKPNDLGREYANYAKLFVNPPPNTTPSGIGFQLPNPDAAGELVYYDDCRQTNGMMAEFKGPGYDGLLAASKSTFVPEWTSVVNQWWDQSGRQVDASDGRPMRWYFADLAVALFAREMFDADQDGGRQRIQVVFLPWSKGRR